MGADGLTAITYSGSASTGNFGQSKSIAGPLADHHDHKYTRAIDLEKPASRATGATMPPAIPGGPPPQPGTLNQTVTPANTAWTQQLEIWVTPWGFLKGAAANQATAKTQRVRGKLTPSWSWSPAAKSPSGQSYRVNGYVNDQNLVERVETWVEHPVLGDLQVEAVLHQLSGLRRSESPDPHRADAERRAGVRSDDDDGDAPTRPTSRSW